MDGEPPHFRDDVPPMDFHRGPPPPRGYAPDYRGYPGDPRGPMMMDPGRRRGDGRGDYGYDQGRYYGGRGPWGGRSRSRSRSPPPGYGARYPGPPGAGRDRERERDRDWQRGGGEEGRNAGNTSGGSRSALAALEPMDTYRVFMMRQDENATPETYQQRYEEYKKKHTQRLMRAFFEDHKKEEWLQERYSPAIRHRAELQKRTKKVTEAKQFVERVASGVARINLDEENDLEGKDYDNDLEDSERILFVRRIPCGCPIATLSEAVKKAGGAFQQIYLSDPVKKAAIDFDRSAYIIYETAEAATEAMPKVNTTFVQDADLFTPFRLQVAKHRPRAPMKAHPSMSQPERITFDLEQATRLASLLDKALFTKETDLQAYGIEAVLARDEVATRYSTEKQKLDVVIAYLRRVHHFIYYIGHQCIDMGDIMSTYPALFCRPPANKEASAGAEEATESMDASEWAAEMDQKIQALIEVLDPAIVEAKKEEEKRLVDEIETREEAALESTYSNYAEKAGDDGKHRCRLCTKLFKALDFVKKHIRNKHPELVLDKIAEVGESYMWEQYREHPDRPLPPVQTTNTLPNPMLGSRGNNNGSPYQNRGGPGRGSNYGPPRGSGYYREGPGYRGYGGPPRESRPRRGSFERGRSPPRRPPEGDLPVDPRQISRSYQDLDDMKDTKVELKVDESALAALPPPKKKAKV